jgi:hypothetical protein
MESWETGVGVYYLSLGQAREFIINQYAKSDHGGVHSRVCHIKNRDLKEPETRSATSLEFGVESKGNLKMSTMESRADSLLGRLRRRGVC